MKKKNLLPISIILIGIFCISYVSYIVIQSIEQKSKKEAPDAPVDLQIIEGDKQIILSWNPPSNNGGSAITGYKVYRGLSSGNEIYLNTVSNVTTYNDTNVTNGDPYFYEISAINDIGEGPKSIEISGIPSTTPTDPLNLNVTYENESILLTWDVPSDNGGANILGYNIYKGISTDNISYYTSVSNVLNYTDTDLNNFTTTYYYKVSAYNKDGEGSLSNEASIEYPERTSDGPSFIVILSVGFIGVISIFYLLKKQKKLNIS